MPIKGLVDDIPEKLHLDISKLDIGDSIKIKDIDFGKLTPLINEGNVLVDVKTARGLLDDEEDEEGEGEGEGESEEGQAASE